LNDIQPQITSITTIWNALETPTTAQVTQPLLSLGGGRGFWRKIEGKIRTCLRPELTTAVIVITI
jgi:hypothetical protein